MQAQVVCPGYDPNHNTNLACEIATATRGASGRSNLNVLPATMAAQLSQLPIATAVSGSGLVFSKALGVFTASTDSLGTILTQRGETLGKHKLFASFTYQRFAFDSIDGVPLDNLQTVGKADFSGVTSYTQATSVIDFTVDQFTALGGFGLTNRTDLVVIVPFSRVSLATKSSGTQYNVSSANTLLSSYAVNEANLAGSASGLGDVAVNLKQNLVKGEKTSLAIAGEVRFPTGAEKNYLGTGAYGIKPYLVFSRRGRLTPNVNIGYQWNGRSALYPDPTTGKNLRLPSSFSYSGGADYRVAKKFTLTGEFIGQYIFNGPRLKPSSIAVPASNGQSQNLATVTPYNTTYTMNSAGVGFKVNPFKHLVVSASVLLKLDDAGLRSKYVPLVGAAYRF
jgi:hypothetical protein